MIYNWNSVIYFIPQTSYNFYNNCKKYKGCKMEKFVMKKSLEANNYKSIRFPAELDNKIKEIVNKANEGKKIKEYSYNGFVISACEYAIKNM